MNYIISGKNIDVTPGLKSTIEQKLGKLTNKAKIRKNSKTIVFLFFSSWNPEFFYGYEVTVVLLLTARRYR